MNIYPFDGIICKTPLEQHEIKKIKATILQLKNTFNKYYDNIIKSVIVAPRGTYCPHFCPYCYQSSVREEKRLLSLSTFKDRLIKINQRYKLLDNLQVMFIGGTIDDVDLQPYIHVAKTFFKNKYLRFAFVFDLLHKNIEMPIRALEQVVNYPTFVYITIDAGSENTRISRYNISKDELVERAIFIIKKFPNIKFIVRSNISRLTQPAIMMYDLVRFMNQQNTMISFTTVKHNKLSPTVKNIDDVMHVLYKRFKLSTFGDSIVTNPPIYTKKLVRLTKDIFIYNPLINQCVLRYKSVIGIGPDYVTPCILHYFKYKSLDDIQYPEYEYTYRDKITRIHECPYIERLYPGYKYPGHDRFTYHFMNIIAKNLEDGLPIWIDINDVFNTEKYYQI